MERGQLPAKFGGRLWRCLSSVVVWALHFVIFHGSEPAVHSQLQSWDVQESIPHVTGAANRVTRRMSALSFTWWALRTELHGGWAPSPSHDGRCELTYMEDEHPGSSLLQTYIRFPDVLDHVHHSSKQTVPRSWFRHKVATLLAHLDMNLWGCSMLILSLPLLLLLFV